jgi:hypothetical protein
MVVAKSALSCERRSELDLAVAVALSDGAVLTASDLEDQRLRCSTGRSRPCALPSWRCAQRSSAGVAAHRESDLVTQRADGALVDALEEREVLNGRPRRARQRTPVAPTPCR